MWIERIDIAIKLVGVIIAGFGVWQYYESLHQARVDRTIRYFDELHSSHVLEARRDLGKLSYQWLDQKMPNGSLPTHEEFDKIVLTDLRKLDNIERVDLLVEFFNRALVCVNNQACDLAAARRLFLAKAREILRLTEPYIEERITRDRDFGLGLRCFGGFIDSNVCFSREL